MSHSKFIQRCLLAVVAAKNMCKDRRTNLTLERTFVQITWPVAHLA